MRIEERPLRRRKRDGGGNENKVKMRFNKDCDWCKLVTVFLIMNEGVL